MMFLTEERVKRLSEIAISPFHLAFDHISDRDRYCEVLRLLEKHDITDVCAYMLFNTPDFSGKGKPRAADSPEDLYERVRINVEFVREVNGRRAAEGRKLMDAFSFPMKYAPLTDTTRKYIGDNWNRKMLAGLREMVGHRHGGFIAAYDSFIEIVGADSGEFRRNILMPNLYIRHNVRAGKTLEKKDIKFFVRNARRKWIEQYEGLDHQAREEFEGVVADNVVSVDKLTLFTSPSGRRLYYHYFFGKNLPTLLQFAHDNEGYREEVLSVIDGVEGVNMLS